MDAELYVEGRDVESSEIALRFDLESSVGWDNMGAAKDYQENKSDQAVVDILQEEGSSMSIKEITNLAEGFPYSTIEHSLRRLSKRGGVEKVERGKYVINRRNG